MSIIDRPFNAQEEDFTKSSGASHCGDEIKQHPQPIVASSVGDPQVATNSCPSQNPGEDPIAPLAAVGWSTLACCSGGTPQHEEGTQPSSVLSGSFSSLSASAGFADTRSLASTLSVVPLGSTNNNSKPATSVGGGGRDLMMSSVLNPPITKAPSDRVTVTPPAGVDAPQGRHTQSPKAQLLKFLPQSTEFDFFAFEGSITKMVSRMDWTYRAYQLALAILCLLLLCFWFWTLAEWIEPLRAQQREMSQAQAHEDENNRGGTATTTSSAAGTCDLNVASVNSLLLLESSELESSCSSKLGLLDVVDRRKGGEGVRLEGDRDTTTTTALPPPTRFSSGSSSVSAMSSICIVGLMLFLHYGKQKFHLVDRARYVNWLNQAVLGPHLGLSFDEYSNRLVRVVKLES